jgi:hypothetical protein
MNFTGSEDPSIVYLKLLISNALLAVSVYIVMTTPVIMYPNRLLCESIFKAPRAAHVGSAVSQCLGILTEFGFSFSFLFYSYPGVVELRVDSEQRNVA